MADVAPTTTPTPTVTPPALDESSWTDGHRAFLLVLLLPTLVLAVRFWMSRPVDPVTAPAMLLDRMLLAATLLVIPLTVLMLYAAKATTAAASTAALACYGLALSVSVLLSGGTRSGADTGVMVLSVLAAVGAAIALWRYGSQAPALGSVAGKLALAALAAAVPLLQLWNSSSFLPSSTQATVTQDVVVEVAKASDESEPRHGVVKYAATNPTDAPIVVVISRMIVCAWGPGETVRYGYSTQRRLDNCQTFTQINDGSEIAADAALTWSRAIALPADENRITVLSRMVYARGDRLRLDDRPVDAGDLGECSSVRVWRLVDESRVKGLAQVDKFLVFADFDSDGGLNYEFALGTPTSCGGGSKELLTYLGTTESNLAVESWY